MRSFLDRSKSRRLRRSIAPFKSFIDRALSKMAFNPQQGEDLQQQSPPFDPSEPSTPVSFPITSLEDLESRAYFESFHFPFNKASVPLPESAAGQLPPRRRLLVCHDMAGGYENDKWVQGGQNAEAYAIWHWYLMDVFVYFSHSLVTLPPPCWTNAAHTHGVKVLGTVITEWDEGRETCKNLLATKESAQMYAERLSELAATLGFDGWLINMEVKLDIGLIDNMIEFVSHLTKMMHSSVPGSLVLWYDSVTIEGMLDWQDQLNKKNKPFFDMCDGIFVNYTWKADYPKLSATFAGDRRYDVYMGIDVFGRNTYGGGQWNTNTVLDLLRKDDVSAAIFAPGWIYETKQPPDFQTAQNSWWSLVERSWGLVQLYPKALPFYTSFDQGHGHRLSIEGIQVASSSWNNISCQGFQPMLKYSDNSNQTTLKVFNNFTDASYNGGGNITVAGNLKCNSSFSARLFRGQLSLEDAPVHLSYSVRTEGNSVLALSFAFSSEADKKTFILVSNYKPIMPLNPVLNKYEEIIFAQTKMAEDGPLVSQWSLYETYIKMPNYRLTDIDVVSYLNGESTTLEPDKEEYYHASLGHISLRPSEQNLEFPPYDSWIIEFKNISWPKSSEVKGAVSLKIIWSLKETSVISFLKYNIYVEKQSNQTERQGSCSAASLDYLGVAKVETFYVSNLEFASDASGLKFVIQACALDGNCQKLSESPSCLLPLDVQ